MIQQGGVFKMDGNEFVVKIRTKDSQRSDGSVDGGVTKIPGDSRF